MRASFNPALSRNAVYVGGIRASAPAVRGSAGSVPAITSRSRAASSTERVIGPGVSRRLSSGAMPVRLTSPTVGRTPTRLLIDAGARTLPPVSVPRPTVPKLAAIATPVPPDEPPLAYARLYGLRVKPGTTELMLSGRPIASSDSDDFASRIAPAFRR